MNTKSILLILVMFLTIQMNSQVRKPNRSKNDSSIKFEFKEGFQKLNIPGSKSFLTMQIKDGATKIVSITKTTKRKTYKLNRVNSTKCKMKCACSVECWVDPNTNQYIGICTSCNADDDELTGQIEFLGPDMKE